MKWEILAIASLVVVSMLVSPAIAQATTISIEDVEVALGGSATVPIYIYDVTDPDGAGTVQLDLLYNASVVQVTGTDDSNTDFSFVTPNIDNTNGIFTVGGTYMGAAPGPTGDVRVIDVTFTAVGSAGKESLLDITNTLLMDATVQQNDITHDVDDGTFTIEGGVAPPTIVSYTISDYTITPPETTEIDVEFSEEVDYTIAIETDSTVVYDWTGTATNPNAKVWDGTYEAGGATVPDGDYTVNVTGTSTTTGLSVNDNTKVITVTSAPDEEPPEISDVASDPTDDSATITWTTDEISDSLVKYGNASGVYTMQESDAADVTSHSIGLTELTANTTYYYVVNSTDPSGNSAESAEYNFTTLPPDETPPTITDVSPDDGATKVSRTTTISATFSEAMNTTSVKEAFSVDGVTGEFSWNGNTVTFTPDANLAYSTKYTVTISTAAKDEAGNPLAAYSWSFTTKSKPRGGGGGGITDSDGDGYSDIQEEYILKTNPNDPCDPDPECAACLASKPAATPTPTPTPTVTPMPTIPPTVTPTTEPTAEPTATPEDPGFEAVFAIAGLLAVAYLVLRRKK
jgi:PGF-CTERM protein